jgi:hypothetical protein
MGIAATLFTGAVCFAEVFKEEDSVVGWSGFWDKDHHVWAVTEFGELVDLTVSELHLHPASKRRDAVPVPAVWWDDLELWPRVIRYLPEGPISIALPCDEMIDLDEFKANVLDVMNRVLNESAVNEIIFHPIMEGVNSINLLTKEGNLWLSKSLKFQDINVPFPEWIQKRENELRQQFSERT